MQQLVRNTLGMVCCCVLVLARIDHVMQQQLLVYNTLDIVCCCVGSCRDVQQLACGNDHVACLRCLQLYPQLDVAFHVAPRFQRHCHDATLRLTRRRRGLCVQPYLLGVHCLSTGYNSFSELGGFDATWEGIGTNRKVRDRLMHQHGFRIMIIIIIIIMIIIAIIIIAIIIIAHRAATECRSVLFFPSLSFHDFALPFAAFLIPSIAFQRLSQTLHCLPLPFHDRALPLTARSAPM